MRVDLDKLGTCDACEKPASLGNFYVYGIFEFRKMTYWASDWAVFSEGSKVCYECQKNYIDEHTFTCVDCGADFYVTVPARRSLRCDECRRIYVKKTQMVAVEKRRTRDLGLTSTLTQVDWIKTLEHFRGRCAYCGGDCDVIEHFTPVVKRGGTDVRNCVPACSKCNTVKQIMDGRTQKQELAEQLNIPIERLFEIERYLSTR